MRRSGEDDTDRTITGPPRENGRAPYAELGKAVGTGRFARTDAASKLHEARGDRGRPRDALSAPALRLDLLAFVFVGWNDPATEEVFLKRVANETAILENTTMLTGAWNYLLKVRTDRTTRDLEAFRLNIVKAVPGVQRTETLVALSSPKGDRTSALVTSGLGARQRSDMAA